jgi:hypothetical protein
VNVTLPIATTFNFNGGPYTYDGAVKTVSVNPNPSGATFAQTGTYAAIGAGTYTATATANGSYMGSTSYNWSIAKANQPGVGISPSTQTVNLGQSVTFTASGGTGGGNYLWGGDASGSGSSNTVTFSSAGTRSVTVYRQGDNNYSDSNAAYATINVIALPVPVITSAQSVSGAIGVPFSYQITATNSPTSYNASNLNGTGLTVTSGGSINGTPTTATTINSTISATNSGGTGSTTLTITFSKPTPDGTFTDHTFAPTGAISHYITQGMLDAVFRHPSNPNAVQPNPNLISYSITQGISPSAPTGTNPVGKYLTQWFSPITITASYPGDNYYSPASVHAVYRINTVYAPSAPTGLRQVLSGATSFSVVWNKCTGIPQYLYPIFSYDVSIDNGESTYVTVTDPLTAVINNLTPNTTYSVVVRGRDDFGNVSGWSAPLTVTTLAAGAPAGYTAQWIDVNGDGLLDEVIDAGTPVFNHLVDSVSTVWATYTQYTLNFARIPAFSYADGYYSDGEGGNYGVSGQWLSYWTVGSVAEEIPVVTPRFEFVVEPGYQYQIGRLVLKPDGSRTIVPVEGSVPTAWTPIIDPGYDLGGAHIWLPSEPMAEAAYHIFPFVLVRLALPGNTPGDDQIFDWEWEDIPGYPASRTWDGVTIEPDFPNWGWQGWPNTWIAPTDDGGNPLGLAYVPNPEDLERYKKADRLRQIVKIHRIIGPEAAKMRRLPRLSRKEIVVILAAGSITMGMDLWLSKQIETKKQDVPWSYVVYEKRHPVTGMVYSGQTIGVGLAEVVLAARDAAHVVLAAEEFLGAEINACITTAAGQSVHALLATGGREQQMMDYHGGSYYDRGSPTAPGYEGRTRARNEIRFYTAYEPLGPTMWATSELAYGHVYRYTGSLTIVPPPLPVPPDKPFIRQESRPPMFFPN